MALLKQMQGVGVSYRLAERFFCVLFVNWLVVAVFYNFLWGWTLCIDDENAMALFYLLGFVSAFAWVGSPMGLLRASRQHDEYP